MHNGSLTGSEDSTLSDTTWLELGESIRGMATDLMDTLLANGADPDEMLLWLGGPAPQAKASTEQ